MYSQANGKYVLDSGKKCYSRKKLPSVKILKQYRRDWIFYRTDLHESFKRFESFATIKINLRIMTIV